ncbi:MAG: DUF4270 domain-containing protein [Paludibacteraceae bacterium]|nr:DUF4270 domain-containing protein [Paludibacteraceae bacterium]
MKSFFCLLCAALLLLPMSGCTDDDDFNNTLQPQRDAINLQLDTFRLTSSSITLDKIPAKVSTDTLMLGIYTADTIGTINGSILAQFDASGEISLPSENGSLAIDSVNTMLRIYFGSYLTSDSEHPQVELSIHRMTQVLAYRGVYYNNIDLASYSDASSLKDTLVELNASMSYIDIPMPQSFTDEFTSQIQNASSTFASTDAFVQFFPGLCLKTEGASNALLSVSSMVLYYQYQYENTLGSKISYSTAFFANKNVRQVNAIKQTPEFSSKDGKEMLILSPGGRSMSVTIPSQKIKEQFGITGNGTTALVEGGRKLAVSSALMRLPVAKQLSMVSRPDYLLLIRKDKYDEYMSSSRLPDNVNEILGTYSSSDTAYLFTLKFYLADLYKRETVTKDDCEFYVVPVTATLNSAGNVVGLVSASEIHAVLVKTELDEEDPLRVGVVVTGF